MALQFWFPFTDGTIENKGVCQDELVIETTPLFKDFGKTGETSYRYGKVKMKAATTAKVLNRNTFSFACWIYPNAETGDTTNRCFLIFGNDPMVENNNRKYSIFNYPSCNDLHLSWQNDDTTYYAGGSWNGVFPSYQWTHFAVTYDNPIYRIYINGELLDEKSGNGNNSSTFAYDTYLFRNPATNNCTFLNDYRVYDTCLSAAEVRELAQGLVLHYPLNNNGFGQENLFPCGGTYTKYCPWTSSLSNKDGSKWVTNSAFEAEPGETYTISIECDGNISNSHKTGGDANPTDKLWALFIYICNTDTQKNWANNQYDTAVLLHSANNNYRKIGNTHVWTITLTNNQKYISLRTNTYSDGETPVTVNWWNIKIEKGNTFTPWIPNESSDLYSIFGLNKKIITDCSEYNRNSIAKVNIPNYILGSPRYTMACSFDGNVDNCFYKTGTTFNYTDNFTYAFWLYPDFRSTGVQQYAFTNGRADSGERAYGVKIANATTLYFIFGNQTYSYEITNQEWIHVAFTKTGNSIKLYKNGKQQFSTTFSGTLPTYGDADGLSIGCFRYYDQYSRMIYPMYGAISDFRIYCTPLSEEAVKELYQTSLKIDKAGKDHTYELCETSGLSINKNGKLISNEFIEAGINLHSGGIVSYTPTANMANVTNYGTNSFVDLSSFVDLGVPITIIIEADFTWENFAFYEQASSTDKHIALQGDSRKRSDGTYTWTNSISFFKLIHSYLNGQTSGTARIHETLTIPTEKFETFDGVRVGLRTNYSDGNGTLTLSNIKVTLVDDKTKFTKSYISANEFIER